MVQQLREITSKYPVTLVVRLCTDSEAEVSFWGELDNEEEFSLDVLDDIWSEAEEIAKAGNSWLTYSPILHTFRTAGTSARSFDLLDERRLAKQQVAFIAEKLLFSSSGGGWGGGSGSAATAAEGEAVPHYGDPEFMVAVRSKLSTGSTSRLVGCALRRRAVGVVDADGLERAVLGQPEVKAGVGGGAMVWLCVVAVLLLVVWQNTYGGGGGGAGTRMQQQQQQHRSGRR
jgi:hypothetical protein